MENYGYLHICSVMVVLVPNGSERQSTCICDVYVCYMCCGIHTHTRELCAPAVHTIIVFFCYRNNIVPCASSHGHHTSNRSCECVPMKQQKYTNIKKCVSVYRISSLCVYVWIRARAHGWWQNEDRPKTGYRMSVAYKNTCSMPDRIQTWLAVCTLSFHTLVIDNKSHQNQNNCNAK